MNAPFAIPMKPFVTDSDRSLSVRAVGAIPPIG
jgi:hypothetical protein